MQPNLEGLSTDRRTRHSLPYMAGLDGLRAIAVAAVVLYHLEISWLPGGFLGVDMFFVVSGFLITSLLLADVRRIGRFDVKDFWRRRARRLLPAVVVVVIAVVLTVAMLHPSELSGLRIEVLGAAGYVTNWVLIFTETSYFEAFSRPPLLRHLWSLAVEEQFYLLWPVAFAAGWALMRRRMLSVVWLGALASAVAMALLYEPLTDPSRVYFGTDTRAVGLLVGVGLAYVTTPQQLAGPATGWRKMRRELSGWLGLAVIAALMVFGDEFSPRMYRGGFLVASVATMALIVGSASPTRLAGWLGNPTFRWLGRRSYGIYLWHWPVLVLTRPELDVPLTGWRLSALQVTATLLLAAATYRWVERPIIDHGFGAWLRGFPRPRRVSVQAATLGGATGLVIVTVAAMIAAPVPSGPAIAAGTPSAITADSTTTTTEAAPTTTSSEHPTTSLAQGPMRPFAASPDLSSVIGDLGAQVRDSLVPHALGIPSTPVSRDDRAGQQPSTTTTTSTTTPPTTTTTTTTEPPPPPTITAVGDSVMLGAAERLSERLGEHATVDALVSRSFADGISVLEGLRDEGALGDIVVVHLGTNGPIDDELVDRLVEATKDADQVYALTVRVPRRWEGQVNETLTAGADRRPRLQLIDWNTASDDSPELFVADGVHLTGEGRQRYADLVAQHILDD